MCNLRFFVEVDFSSGCKPVSGWHICF